MSDDGYFAAKKSLAGQAGDLLIIALDVLIAFVTMIPMIIISIYKLVFYHKKDVHGKLALVSGGGNGLGRALCLKLAELGCNIAVVDVDLKAAEKTAEEIKAKGVQARAYKADVTKTNEIIQLRNDSQKDLGPVDILINNAGLMSNKSLDESPEYIELMVKVNVLGPMLMTKVFLEQMKEHGSGHIVSISSMSGCHPYPNSIPYSSTKFAVSGFMSALTEHLRVEKWRPKIKTTCVYPYFIKTRREVIESLNPNIRFPPIEVDETAIDVVEAIQREDFNITIPSHQKPMLKFLNIFPLRVQEMIRDRVLREYDFINPNCTLNFHKD